MNYTKLKQELEAEAMRVKEAEDNTLYAEAMRELNIEVML